MVRVEFVTSIHSLPKRIVLSGNIAAHEDFLKRVDSSGLQYMPVRSRQGYIGNQLAAAGLVCSLHQSWLTGQGRFDRLLGLVIPGMVESVGVLGAVQAAHHGPAKLPVVAHPNEQFLGGHPPHRAINYRQLLPRRSFGPLLHQPTVEVLEAWEVLNKRDAASTAEAMLQAQRVYGFGGIALDLYHLTAKRAGHELPLAWCEEFVGTLAARRALAYPNEVQLAFRPDFGDKNQRAEEYDNLNLALRSDITLTPQGTLLQAMHEAMPASQSSLRVTIETPPHAFRQLGVPVEWGNYVLMKSTEQFFAA